MMRRSAPWFSEYEPTRSYLPEPELQTPYMIRTADYNELDQWTGGLGPPTRPFQGYPEIRKELTRLFNKWIKQPPLRSMQTNLVATTHYILNWKIKKTMGNNLYLLADIMDVKQIGKSKYELKKRLRKRLNNLFPTKPVAVSFSLKEESTSIFFDRALLIMNKK
jgi:hypothetical protein